MPTPNEQARCYGATSGGTHYALGSPSGGVVTSTLSGAGTSLDDQTLRTASNAGDSVHMSFACSPVTIDLVGATSDGNGGYDILVGQRCSPTLAGVPSACTVSNYQWSVSGTTFQSWSSDTPANAGNPYNPDASYYVSGSGPMNVASPGWYWNETGNNSSKSETVSCTATVTPPANQGAAFTVTASQPVTVWVPAWTCTGTGGTMQVNTSEPAGNGSDYWLWAGPIAGSGEVGGMDWRATVSPPTGTSFTAGSLVIVQLIIPELNYYVGAANSIFGVHYVYTENGQEGLDTDYPYPWVQGAPQYFSNDNPGLNLSATGATSATVGDQFEDYLMYFPPSSVQCVPLAHFVWSTNGNAAIPGSGNWAAFGSGSAGAVTPSGTATSFLSDNSFPMWTQNSGNGTGTFAAQ